MNIFAYEGAHYINRIVIVGVGGTGAALAAIVARMLWQRQTLRQSVPALHLIDGDAVEAKNVGRQHFFALDIGQNKAAVTARRLSLLYGLPIEWSDEMLDAEKHGSQGALMVDCTDNHLARLEILKAARLHRGQLLGCGNSRTHGQVILGACDDRELLASTIRQMESDVRPNQHQDSVFRSCYHLPHFGLLYPELLEPEPETTQPALSCADLVMQAEQHLLINDAMALVAGQYIYKLLHREPITTFMTTLDLHNLSLESAPIGAERLRTVLKR